MKIDKIRVYDLEESLIASGYPMRTELVERHADEKDIKRAKNLTKASNGNGAHGQWLTGVRVAFDLTCTNKMWVEAERYRFLEFVSSQSTMHRITKFDLRNQYNGYVDPRCIDIMEEKVEQYNSLCELQELAKNLAPDAAAAESERLERLKKQKYLELLYSNPAGFELTARMTTNYRCLLNIYVQRHNHRLPEWREFCQELLKLPLFQELVDAYYSGKIVED
jgi:hypothetical protein